MTDKEKAMQDLLAHGKTFAQHLPSVGLKCGRLKTNFHKGVAVLLWGWHRKPSATQTGL